MPLVLVKLIDNSLLDVYVIILHPPNTTLTYISFFCSSQSDLEANLFKVYISIPVISIIAMSEFLQYTLHILIIINTMFCFENELASTMDVALGILIIE